MANYKQGDEIVIRTWKWWSEAPTEVVHPVNKRWFNSMMSNYCGQTAKIKNVYNDGTYEIDIDDGKYRWEDYMFEDKIASDEKIICAAIHYDNGEQYHHQEQYGIKTGFVLAGYRHHNIMSILPENILFKSSSHLLLNVKWNDKIELHKVTQGFLTSKGRFADRKEAARIALDSKQIKKLNYSKTELYSEDLY